MSPRLRRFAVGSVTLLGLAGCSTYVREQRPAWRAEAENACLARNVVQETSFLRASNEISGPGICGLTHPFKATALADGSVTLNSTATLDCSMISALDTWIKEVVQPVAQARFGEPVVRINTMGSYSCRGINNMSGAKLSEHAFGNALDIGGFVLASGRELNIMRGFNGADEQERAFLHEAHAGACGYFTTVLGPGYNIFHYNHIHIDLAMHGSTSRGPRRYCKPVPEHALPEPPKRDNLPDPPPIEEEMDIARAPIPAPSLGMSGPSIVAGAPRPVPVSRAAAYTPVSRSTSAMMARTADPVRSHAVEPAPLITFREEDQAPRQPVQEMAPGMASAAPRPFAQSNSDEDAAVGGGNPPDARASQFMGRLSDGDAEPVVTEPARRASDPGGSVEIGPRDIQPQGTPADWDLTSSVK